MVKSSDPCVHVCINLFPVTVCPAFWISISSVSKRLTSLATNWYLGNSNDGQQNSQSVLSQGILDQSSLQCRAHAEWQTTIHTHINTHGPFRPCTRLNVCVFGQWEEAGVAGGKEELSPSCCEASCLTPNFVKILLNRNHLYSIWLRVPAQWGSLHLFFFCHGRLVLMHYNAPCLSY